MANRTVKEAQTIKGTNPQYLIEKIIRSRIYDSKYWKEECFALTSELLVDKAMELRYVAGTYAGNIKPSPFLCLCLKMLQIQPQKDIIVEFIKNEDYKYVRALGAFYLRLVGSSVDCYKYLEPLLNDYRKIRMQRRDGKFELSHMDEFVDHLLRAERECDVILPRIQKREVLEEAKQLEPRVSVLEGDLDEDSSSSSSSSEDEREEGETRDDDEYKNSKQARRSRDESAERRRKRRREDSRERDRDRRKKRSRSRSPKSSSRRRERSRDRDRERERDYDRDRNRHREKRKHKGKDRTRDRDRDDKKESKSRSGGKKDDLSVEETNKLRESLGLAPLK